MLHIYYWVRIAYIIPITLQGRGDNYIFKIPFDIHFLLNRINLTQFQTKGKLNILKWIQLSCYVQKVSWIIQLDSFPDSIIVLC